MEVYAVIEEFDMSDFSDRHGDTAPDYERVLSIHGTMEEALAEVDRLSAQNARSVKEFGCDECHYWAKPYKVQQCPNPKKIKMNLTWHDCNRCPPEEPWNSNLIMWDGEKCFPISWRCGEFFDDRYSACGEPVDTVDGVHWWADLQQTAAKYFKGKVK